MSNAHLDGKIGSMLAGGLSQRQVADNLNITRWQVRKAAERIASGVEPSRPRSNAVGGLGTRDVSRYLVIPDPHTPFHDRRSWEAVRAYIEAHSWHGVIVLGDLLDFNEISVFTRSSLRNVSEGAIVRQYQAGNEFLSELEESLSVRMPDEFDRPLDENITSGVPKYLLEGNHEARLDRWLDEMGVAASGLVEIPRNLNLDERGWTYVRSWTRGELVRIGHASFIHGRWTNIHHAKKHVEAYATNIFYGHTHDVQRYSFERLGDDKTIVGQSLGTLQRYDAPYLRGGPTRWQQAFGTFWFRPNGFFNYSVTNIFNGAFVAPDGVLYRG